MLIARDKLQYFSHAGHERLDDPVHRSLGQHPLLKSGASSLALG